MKIISKFTKELFVLNYNHKIKAWVLSEKSYGNNVVLIKKIFPFIKTLCIDNLWLSKNQNSSLGKLLFRNGFVDMKTFILHEEFNPEIIFFSRIEMDFVPMNEQQMNYKNDIYHRLFEIPLGKEVVDDFFIEFITRIGRRFDETILFWFRKW